MRYTVLGQLSSYRAHSTTIKSEIFRRFRSFLTRLTILDIPEMTAPWSATVEPVWRWLREPWTFPVPKNSEAVTDLAALRGKPVTETARWEENYWELFAGRGPDVPKEEKRVVALGTLVAADPSLAAVMNLKLGTGLWRDGHSEWHPRGKQQSNP